MQTHYITLPSPVLRAIREACRSRKREASGQRFALPETQLGSFISTNPSTNQWLAAQALAGSTTTNLPVL